MKNYFLFVSVLLSVNFAYSQDFMYPRNKMYSNDTTYTAVKDTAYNEDERFRSIQFIVQNFSSAINNYNTTTKLSGRTPKFRAESKAVLNKLENILKDYKALFLRVDTIYVPKKILTTKYINNLQLKIDSLRTDAELVGVENRQEFLNLKNQLTTSKKYKRNQITVIK